LAATDVVPLGDVVIGHLLAVDRAGALVFDPAAVGAVHLMEADVLLLGGGVQLDRDRHQAERDRTFPDRAHDLPPTPMSWTDSGRTRLRIASLRRLRKAIHAAYGDRVSVAPLSPMLATAGRLPLGPGWSYEFKWDGVRVISAFDDDGYRLYARS